LAVANTGGQAQEVLALGSAKRSGTRAYEPFVPGPNPRLKEFIAEHAKAYDPATDKYDVGPFDRDLIVDKAAPPKAIYDMHGSWSKKHWAAIREYIKHYLPMKYYPRGTGVVLDCFSGSGMTGVAAMMEDRPCLLIDTSPAAAFISHCYTHPVDPEDLQTVFDRMMIDPYPMNLIDTLTETTGQEIRNLRQELAWLYETRCDRCGGKGMTDYIVYSQRFQCPNCAQVVALFDCPEVEVEYQVGAKRTSRIARKRKTVCPFCLEANQKKGHRDFVISTRTRTCGAIPVLVHYTCANGCKPKSGERRHDDDRRTRKGKYFNEHDLTKIQIVDRVAIPHWFPDRKMMDVDNASAPWGIEWRPGRDFRTVAELYTKPNLWALAAIDDAIARQTSHTASAQIWKAGLTAICLNASKMYRYRPSGKGGIKNGSYYLPQLAQIMCPGSQFSDKRKDIIDAEKSLASLPNAVLVDNSDARRFHAIAGSVDYIFTDPSYVGKVQYGELNFIWESWLGFSGAWLENEIVVNPFRRKSVDDWDRDLRGVLSHCYAALKPGRWLSLCYHDTDPATWARVQNMLFDTGFEIHTVTVLDPKQKSSNQLTAEKVVKSDLVLNCRKPRPGERGENGEGEAKFVSERVREILIETLSLSGGQPRERLWDTVLKRLLARGQMAEHRFDDILSAVAFRSESGRWFLKEEFESLSESDLKNEENAGSALTAFARLRCLGLPAAFAAQAALNVPKLASEGVAEKNIEQYVRQNLIKDAKEASKFKLGAVLKGTEFYDCLFFYLTRWLKTVGQNVPRRNLAEFLDEYLVHFREGDKWLYRPPDQNEAAALKEARQSGLGRRIRRYVSFLNGDGDYAKEQMQDIKTLVAWLRHCAHFGLADEGVALFEKGGLQMQISRLSEEDQYDADDYYQQCRRRAQRSLDAEPEEPSEEEESVS
jgi:DNA modification methylase